MTQINYCPHCGKHISELGKFCPECGSSLNEKKGEANRTANSKRERVLNNKTKKSKNSYLAVASVAVLVLIIIFYSSQPSKEYKVIKEQPKVVSSVSYPSTRYDQNYSVAFAKNGKIIFPLDLVKEKKMVKFDYIHNGAAIPLLAYLSEDGKVITAISMCEPCNSTDFHIQSDNLICNSCGTTWNLNDLEAISGSCGKYPPDPVPSKVVGNEIQIDESLVVSWQRRV